MIFNIEFDQTDSLCEFLDIRATNAKEVRRVIDMLDYVLPPSSRNHIEEKAPETQKSSNNKVTHSDFSEDILTELEYLFYITASTAVSKNTLSLYELVRIGTCVAKFYKNSSRKIPAIKLISQITGLGLKDSKELFENYCA